MRSLKLNIHIYKKKAIYETICAFSHLGKMTLTTDSEYYRIKLTGPSQINRKLLFDEFSNYVLGATKR
jgi:hypothetical protein